MSEIEKFSLIPAQGQFRPAIPGQSTEEVIEGMKNRYPGIRELMPPKALSLVTKTMPDAIREAVSSHPKLAYITSLRESSSLLVRNAPPSNPFLHNVRMYAAFKDPEFDSGKMVQYINEVYEILHSSDKMVSGNTVGVIHRDRFLLGTLGGREEVGKRVAQTMWAFQPNPGYSGEEFALAGIETNQIYTKVETKPVTRYVSVSFSPFVEYAMFAATVKEMSNIDSQEERKYPFRNSMSYSEDLIWMKDYEELKKHPVKYLQFMAERCLEGYKVAA